MDFTRVNINRPEFQDLNQGLNSQHVFAEVVLVDKSQEGSVPQLYQLKKEQLTASQSLEMLKQEFISLPHPAFILMGEIQELHTQKKKILLFDGTIVSYKFMILIAGFDQGDEISSVLYTLKDAMILDALNIKNKIFVSTPTGKSYFTMPKKTKKRSFNVPAPSIASHLKYIAKIATPKINEGESKSVLINLNAASKKLCILQM